VHKLSHPSLLHCKKKLQDSWIYFDQTFLGLGLGKLFPARESLVSDILAGDGNPVNLFLQCKSPIFQSCPLGVEQESLIHLFSRVYLNNETK